VHRATLTLTTVALVALALVCSGCETTAEKSAMLEKAAKRVARAQQTGLAIAHESTVVKAVGAVVVRGKEGSAAVVTLRNTSSHALRDVPIAISLKDAHGTSVYANDTPGLAATLTSVALIPARGEVTWIDDQATTVTAASVSARIGEGAQAGNVSATQVGVQGAHLSEDPSGGFDAEGTVVNHSHIEQDELVIYAVARRDGKVVAAGRAVLTSLGAGASLPFQVFFVGDPKGGQLALSAPPTAPAA
jgi:hypothetical protein